MYTIPQLTALGLASALLLPGFQEQADPAPAFVQVQGDSLEISFDAVNGTSLADFVAFAETLSEVPLDYDTRDFEGIVIRSPGTRVLPKTEFWSYFQAVLKSRDFLLVPYGNISVLNRDDDGPNSGFYAVRSSSQGGGSRGSRPGYIKSQAPVVTPEQLDAFRHDPGIVLTTSFSLKNVNVQEAANMLQTYFTDPMFESVRAVSNSNTLVATGFAQTLHGIKQLIALIDVEPAQLRPTFSRIKLQHAVANEIKPIVESMIAADFSDGNARGPQRAQHLPATLHEPLPRVEVDQRTNALLVLAAEKSQQRIGDFVRALDIQIDSQGEGDTRVVHLKNAIAEDLASTLREWAQSLAPRPAVAAGRAGRPEPSERISVVADAASNSLLVTASRTRHEQLDKLIGELDVRKRKVLVETLIEENEKGR